MEKKEIQKKDQNRAFLPQWNEMKEQAQVLIASGFFPPTINTVEKAIAVGMAGRELGIGLMEAVRSVRIIQGLPTLSPQLMLALANRTRMLENIMIEQDTDGCAVTIKRRGRSPHKTYFGKAEAISMGLMTKDNYRKQPHVMYQWRAVAANLRITFPDVVFGFSTPEEMGEPVAITDSGELVMKGDVVAAPPAAQIAQAPAPAPAPAAPPPPAEPQTYETTIIPEKVTDMVSADRKTPFWTIQDIEGGTFYTNDKELAERCKLILRDKGTITAVYEFKKRGLVEIPYLLSAELISQVNGHKEVSHAGTH